VFDRYMMPQASSKDGGSVLNASICQPVCPARLPHSPSVFLFYPIKLDCFKLAKIYLFIAKLSINQAPKISFDIV
jgi:hypothetical protein